MLQQFLSWKFPSNVEYIVGYFFLWSGLAIWSGMISRIFVRTEKFQNTWMIYVMGFVGACLGPVFARNFLNYKDLTPISPAGICLSVLATLCCMTMYYIVSFMLKNDDFEDNEDSGDIVAHTNEGGNYDNISVNTQYNAQGRQGGDNRNNNRPRRQEYNFKHSR